MMRCHVNVFVDGQDGVVSLKDYPEGKDIDGDGYVDGELHWGTDIKNADNRSRGLPVSSMPF